MKRWGNMARVFTKLGKEITIAVKAGGPEPETNPRLRVLMQTAKKENMPKENVERAIKKASSKDFSDYKEMNYEGYGPFGIAIFVETATGLAGVPLRPQVYLPHREEGRHGSRRAGAGADRLRRR